jgi:hypothetical protein
MLHESGTLKALHAVSFMKDHYSFACLKDCASITKRLREGRSPIDGLVWDCEYEGLDSLESSSPNHSSEYIGS